MTLIEVAVATAIIGIASWASLEVLMSSAKVQATGTLIGELNLTARRTVDRIARDIRFSGADSDGWTFPEGGPRYQASFSRCIGYDTTTGLKVWSPVVAYAWEVDGNEAEDGADNDGDGAIDEGTVYRSVGGGRRVILAQRVEKQGFILSRTANTVTIRVGLARPDPRHRSSVIRGSFETVVILRN